MDYMRPHLETLKRLGFNPGSILDVGAAHGHFVAQTRLVWPEAKVTCVEANPECIPHLQRTGAEVHIRCLSDRSGPRTFWTTSLEAASGGCSYYREKRPAFLESGIAHEVQATTLMAEFGDRTFDLIKLDTQGSELDILFGGETVVWEASVIIVECSFLRGNFGVPLIAEVVKDMSDYGFEIFGFCGPQDGCHRYEGRQSQTDVFFIRRDLGHYLELP